jgi:hypothetical protein
LQPSFTFHSSFFQSTAFLGGSVERLSGICAGDLSAVVAKNIFDIAGVCNHMLLSKNIDSRRAWLFKGILFFPENLFIYNLFGYAIPFVFISRRRY